jgi:hypothetical protein
MADLHGGDGAVVCSACTQTFTVDVRQLRRKIEEGKRLLAVDEPDPLGHSEGLGPEDLPVLISAIDALAPLVPHSAHPQLQLIHLAASLLLPSVKEPSARARALALLDRSLAGGAHSFPAHHPTLALWAAERARVLMLPISPATSFLKDVVEAVDALRTAIKQCDSAFGKGGTVARGLRTELEHAEQIAAMVAARS